MNMEDRTLGEVLSEESIALGGMPVAFTDFTDGKWIYETAGCRGKWSLDEIFE